MVFVNGELAAYVRTGEKVTLHIPAGEVIQGVEAGGICAGGLAELEAKLSIGKPVQYRIGYGQSGDISIYRTTTK